MGKFADLSSDTDRHVRTSNQCSDLVWNAWMRKFQALAKSCSKLIY